MNQIRFSLLLVLTVILFGTQVFCQKTIPVSIKVGLLEEASTAETIHLRIADSLSGEIMYDTLAHVSIPNGFSDTVFLLPGTYKCEILEMGALVKMPEIRINGGELATWGYPEYEYFLLKISELITGIETNPLFGDVTISPNPIINFLDIDTESKICAIEIYGLNGLKVFSDEKSLQHHIQIDLSNLSSGFYILELKGRDITKKYRILKK